MHNILTITYNIKRKYFISKRIEGKMFSILHTPQWVHISEKNEEKKRGSFENSCRKCMDFFPINSAEKISSHFFVGTLFV